MKLPSWIAAPLLVLSLAGVTSFSPVRAAYAASAAPIAVAQPAPPDDATLGRQLDALIAPLFKAGEPGMALLVARNGRPVYRKAFGAADLAGKVRLRPENAFRIGSVTKQFTAALVLRQVERGTLALEDDITTYLPDYPVKGKVITIAHLLGHTSGIANYTDRPDFESRMNRPFTHEALIGMFKDEPLKFAPGEAWSYSNSGYYLLGVILEKVTGKSYAALLKDEIFDPLGMTHSGYGKDVRSLPDEVAGFTRKGDAVVAAAPLSMTAPFSAGAIVSSVDDLLRWDNGLEAGRILTPASLKTMFTSFATNDGRPTGYACGWGVNDYEGHPVQEHNGGINGFFSHVTRMPDDRVYVALLFNTEEPPVNGDFLALRVAAIAIGKPLPEPGAFTMTPGQLDRFVGVYAIDATTDRVISRKDGTLYSRRGGGATLELFPTSDSTFAFVGRPGTLIFSRDAAGKIASATIIQSGIRQVALRTDKPLPPERVEVVLQDAQLDACVGTYALAPTFQITVTRGAEGLEAQATGQQKLPLFAESPTLFFYKVVDAQIEFTPGADGRMASLTLHQGGQHIPGSRVP